MDARETIGIQLIVKHDPTIVEKQYVPNIVDRPADEEDRVRSPHVDCK